MNSFSIEASTDQGKTWAPVDTDDFSFSAIRCAKERAARPRRWERVINVGLNVVLITVDETGMGVYPPRMPGGF